jgi:hypothetical protein
MMPSVTIILTNSIDGEIELPRHPVYAIKTLVIE